MTARPLAAALLLAVPLVQPLAPAAFAQSSGLTLAQVEQKYPRMSPVHIEKCDRDGDGLYTRSEMHCVAGIYQAMYLDR
jgi:hypothetical protein